MKNIDWNAEAEKLADEENFVHAKKREMVPVLSRAMQKGAALMAKEVTGVLRMTTQQISDRHNDNVRPDSGQTKLIEPLEPG